MRAELAQLVSRAEFYRHVYFCQYEREYRQGSTIFVLQVAIQWMAMKVNRTKADSPRTSASPLMVRLDKDSKAFLMEAAKLRGLSVSDYVRTTTVAQARKEVAAARSQTIVFSPEEQLAFWQALQQPPDLTPAQRRLGDLMRGVE